MTTTGAGEEHRVRVRQAVQADLLAVLRIERASFSQPWPFSAFERYLGEQGFLVATDGDSVVGYVVADLIPNHGQPLGHIKDIAVHPDRRGEGLGSMVLRRALGVLESNGAASVKLEVRASNDKAISLYKSYGFEYLRTIPRYYDDGEDALILVLDIDQQ
ncbi:ribosomal protein S18-alanine N-acetyltransferase [Halorussus halophilus]|uniref:ribosomal protein S18-alanine N-acetyltransferase n=1 Tax=Halorussus halophilus TaxID=2650975 RepID=UPI001CE4025E|nr:ribosomal protein S18-alanine N-acetyltransferase [Halorussus halophilus]